MSHALLYAQHLGQHLVHSYHGAKSPFFFDYTLHFISENMIWGSLSPFKPFPIVKNYMNKTNFINDDSVYHFHQTSANEVKQTPFGDFLPNCKREKIKFYQTTYCICLSVTPSCMLFHNKTFL